MTELKDLEKDLTKKIFLFSIPVVLLLFGLGRSVIAVSFIFGIAIGFLNFHLTLKDLSSINFLDAKSSQRKLLKSYFLRYMVLFLSFTLVFLYQLHIIGFIVGFFKVKLLLALIHSKENHG